MKIIVAGSVQEDERIAPTSGALTDTSPTSSAKKQSLQKSFWGGLKPPSRLTSTALFPFFMLGSMIGALLLLDAILPLRDLWFHEAQLTQMGAWPVMPSLLLFPGWTVIPPVPQTPILSTPDILQSWGITGMLLGALLVVFVIYIQALRSLPARISHRYLFASTLVLGLLYALIPVVTSPDLYSYIAYARIGAMFHLNPLTTIPRAINHDVIYSYVVWVDQPSAYGPTWAVFTVFFQWLLSLFGLGSFVLPMVLVLRLLGLVAHLFSARLIWSIGGSLQRLNGFVSQEKRLFATLAFAWNPLLLLEDCTNAHNDALLLLFILLAIWFLVRQQQPAFPLQPPRRAPSRLFRFLPAFSALPHLPIHLSPAAKTWLTYLAPSALLAVATCLKVNVAIFMPGLVLYLWRQEAQSKRSLRWKRVSASAITYVLIILALYTPFWQDGAVLDVFQVNPATYRTINSLADFTGHFYNGLLGLFGFTPGAPVGSPAEHFTHNLGMDLFAFLYCVLAWQLLRSHHLLRDIQSLLSWMAVIWLLYCALGSPWFWPWYMVTFFGIYALIEASRPAQALKRFDPSEQAPDTEPLGTNLARKLQALLLRPGVVYWSVFSMLSLYCFITWGPMHSFVPGLPGFTWSALAGLWAWLLPLLGFRRASFKSRFLTMMTP